MVSAILGIFNYTSCVKEGVERTTNVDSKWGCAQCTKDKWFLVCMIKLSTLLWENQLSDEVTYELKDQAYCFKLVKRPDDLFALSARLTKWLSQVEISKVS